VIHGCARPRPARRVRSSRRRTAATIPVPDHLGQPVELTPDDMAAGFTVDLVAAVRDRAESHRIHDGVY